LPVSSRSRCSSAHPGSILRAKSPSRAALSEPAANAIALCPTLHAPQLILIDAIRSAIDDRVEREMDREFFWDLAPSIAACWWCHRLTYVGAGKPCLRDNDAGACAGGTRGGLVLDGLGICLSCQGRLPGSVGDFASRCHASNRRPSAFILRVHRAFRRD